MNNRIFIGWFGLFMFPLLAVASLVFIFSIVLSPSVDIDGIREPVSGSLLYGNNIISCAVIPSSNAIGIHLYAIWDSVSLDEWFYNGGSYQLVVLHFFIGVSCWLGRE
jgi:photosystem II P680 reaction center D1 protein